MRWRGALCALIGTAAFAAAVPGAGADGTCQDGREDGAAAAYDADGDGLVCVDVDTGAVWDDAAAAPGIVDRNADGVVCVRQTGSGSIVRTDNNAANEENFGCPPAFQPSPLT